MKATFYLFYLISAIVLLGAVPSSAPMPYVTGEPLPDKPTLTDCSKGCSIYYATYINGETGKREFAHVHIRSAQPVEIWESTDARF